MLDAPFPWFGGKKSVAREIWWRFGDVRNYVEPFFGSGAVLLQRPQPFDGVETINDADGFVANFWRAIQAAPDDVARWCNSPVNETDLHARHYWLVTKGVERLQAVLGDPEGFDAQVAGWWCWGLCSWIGGGWCSGEGPWQWDGGAWVKGAGPGINRKLPHLALGRGINRKSVDVREWFACLSERLRRVRVAYGDWSRVTGPSVTFGHGKTAVFLDPPYGDVRTANVYAQDDLTVSAEVRAWAIEVGKRPDMLVCLAGYSNEHEMPGDWSAVGFKAASWMSKGGYANQSNKRGRENAAREMLWFSPACAVPGQQSLL